MSENAYGRKRLVCDKIHLLKRTILNYRILLTSGINAITRAQTG
jgi:hypothetical protein